MTDAAPLRALDAFWLADDGATLLVFDRARGVQLRLDGAVRDAVNAPSPSPLLRAIAEADPGLAPLARAVLRGAPTPLSRAALLRGGGWGTLFVEVTARCNERCSHCYADASPERHESLDRAVLASVIDDAAAMGFRCVQFTGGDPLLHPSLVEAVARARGLGIARVELFTNGLALTPGLLDRLAPHGVAFAFSVYSHEPATHDAITGVPGSHRRTLQAIARCLARGLGVRVGVTLFAHTAGDRAATRDALRALGLDDDAVRFSTERAVGRGSAFDAQGGGAHAPREGEADGKACVSATGDVHPCIFARDVRLGNVRERGLRAVLEDATPVRTPPRLAEGLAAAADRLACVECRVRDALLQRPTLHTLRRRA